MWLWWTLSTALVVAQFGVLFGGTSNVGILRTRAPQTGGADRSSMAQNRSLHVLRNWVLNPDPFATPSSSSSSAAQRTDTSRAPIAFCDFETPCQSWQGDDNGFRVVSGRESGLEADPPKVDAGGNARGHFLYVEWSPAEGNLGKFSNFQVYSRVFDSISEIKCRLTFLFHGRNIKDGTVSIFSKGSSGSWVHEKDYPLVSNNSWVLIRHYIGRRKKPFQLSLEVLPPDGLIPFHAAFDNITMEPCFPGGVHCDQRHFECQPDVCVDRTKVCDINRDCTNGADEEQLCDQFISWNAYCTFEDGQCGWKSDTTGDFQWKLHNDTINGTGNYMTVKRARGNATFGHFGRLTSAIFPPPPREHGDSLSPHFNSCQVRFTYRIPTKNKLMVEVTEYPFSTIPITIWSRHVKEDSWQWASVPIPPLKHRYQITFVAYVFYISQINFDLDNISLSPECFVISGENVSSRYTFSTCGAQGRRGPTNQLCRNRYRYGGPEVQVSDNGSLAGIQQWTVPKTTTYSVFAVGASGGKGANYPKGSFGAVARGIFQWREGETIFLLVGQEGGSASALEPPPPSLLRRFPQLARAGGGGGGGGGGATYVFKMENDSGPLVPLLVAAGGGGQCWDMKYCNADSNAGGYDSDLPAVSGKSTQDGAGGGGGWRDVTKGNHAGLSLVEGGLGGLPCKKVDQNAEGGFGGGGGPCLSGGGGGGYAGGSVAINDSQGDNGFGGHSYVASEQYAYTGPGNSYGPGSVVIVPAFDGCGCDHDCVIIELETSAYSCICDENYQLSDDNVTCLMNGTLILEAFLLEHLVVVLLVTTVILIGLAIVMFFLYQRYRRQTAQQVVRQEYVGNPVLQLNRLRQTTSGMVTEYNPNYEFGGSTCTIQDLAEVPRENLALVMALGQGAFGEVYQGYLSKVPGELGDIPVAIKTLPELSSSQAEMDFLMEALIMSKFSHPNIVKFIGVCFEKLPKFIVLELLPGGDLKSFLRESRPKPDKPSPLTMKDLLVLAIDVAKGCHYLEENHFIHRDIAARNCLLTTKEVKRVVKIADFGMARDIYRADYYRKGGKAMLPVKWMPPEAFLDGIFTSKTDVWSFGVLLWEVMSLGYMPYPGRGNQDVMQLVTSGGRLEPPSNCPQPVYHIMSQCWHPVPEERPDFTTILERLGYCLQDHDVTEAPLPVFHRPPSTERDATVMRPADPDNICLQVQRGDTEPQSPASTDYLIPIPSSSYSLCTEKTELQSASSMDSVDHLLELDDKVGELPQPNATGASAASLKPHATAGALRSSPTSAARPAANWETSFMQSFQPKSHQPPTAWSGEYQSVPTHEDPATFQLQRPAPSVAIAAIPPPESSPARKSPPSAIARQRPSVKKPGVDPEARPPTIPPASLPLDPAALTKHHQAQVLPYANVAMAADPGRTNPANLAGSARNEPYTITAPRGAAPPGGKGRYDKDATC